MKTYIPPIAVVVIAPRGDWADQRTARLSGWHFVGVLALVMVLVIEDKAADCRRPGIAEICGHTHRIQAQRDRIRLHPVGVILPAVGLGAVGM